MLVHGRVLLLERPFFGRFYFTKNCKFGFDRSTSMPVLRNHDTLGYVFRHAATLERTPDGVAFLHRLDLTRPEESRVAELVKMGAMYLSPGLTPPGRPNIVTSGKDDRVHTPKNRPISHYPIAEVSYTAQPGQRYLEPLTALLENI